MQNVQFHLTFSNVQKPFELLLYFRNTKMYRVEGGTGETLKRKIQTQCMAITVVRQVDRDVLTYQLNSHDHSQSGYYVIHACQYM